MGAAELVYNIWMLFEISSQDASSMYIGFTTLKLLITLGIMIAACAFKEKALPFAGPAIMLHKLVAFVLVLQSEAEEVADENFDRKMYAISGYTYVLIVLCFLSMRPKVDLFVTIPLAYFVSYVFVKRGYSEDDSNMACFTNPKNFVESTLLKIYGHQILVCVFWFVVKKNKVSSFL